ncbi:hypothetical protein EIP91_007814 [Steccherinum ochraceum]|uniref:NADAR domain-containing protein n=1 Tax=Steccherinum ochraceum TaxID=92696 RepID=A0A4R0R9G2_9APHY|nr:hypothetical protein EIP91_007814 [Steccherinum ochraceum]
MSSSNVYARDGTVRSYTPEQWSRRIQGLQSSIYGPPVSQPTPLNNTTDTYGQPYYPETRASAQIPQVINTTVSEGYTPGRSKYATNGDSRSSYGGAYYEDPHRPGPTMEDVRPLYRDKLETKSPKSRRDYGGDSGYLSGEGEDYGREFGERRRSHGYDVKMSPTSAYGGSTRKRRVSEYGHVSPHDSGSQAPVTPLRGILHHRPSHASMRGEYSEQAYESTHVEDSYDDPAYADFAEARPSHGTPYPARTRRLSDAGPLVDQHRSRPPSQANPHGSRPPSIFDGPVIPGQTTRSPGHSSRPPTMYGASVAPVLQSQERSVNYPPTRMTSRPTSTQGFPGQAPGSSHRASTTIHTPVIDWHAQQSAGGPRTQGRNVQRIYFYHKGEPYYGFTNFSPHAVLYNGKQYPTSEHLFQSFKFHDYRPDLAERIRVCSSHPKSALAEARRLEPEMRPDWYQINLEKMYETLRLKFSQHLDLRAELLSTGDAILIEDSDQDAFWGCGADGRGRNELGKALMRLREELHALM